MHSHSPLIPVCWHIPHYKYTLGGERDTVDRERERERERQREREKRERERTREKGRQIV